MGGEGEPVDQEGRGIERGVGGGWRKGRKGCERGERGTSFWHKERIEHRDERIEAIGKSAGFNAGRSRTL